MKCIQSTTDGSILRVHDWEADKMVSKNNWEYVSKKEWKEKVRDVKKVPSAVVAIQKETDKEMLREANEAAEPVKKKRFKKGMTQKKGHQDK